MSQVRPEPEMEVYEDPCRHVYFSLTAGKAVLRFSVVLYGMIAANPSGSTAATMNLYDGDDTSGNPDFPYTLAASESIADAYGDRGVLFANGVYVNVTAGQVNGSLLYRPRRHS